MPATTLSTSTVAPVLTKMEPLPCSGVAHDLGKMEKIARMDDLGIDAINELVPTVTALRADLRDCLGQTVDASPLARLAPTKRRVYEELFGLIYECSTNRVAAKALVDRIMLKIV
jgi:hypothetical protein